MATGANLAAYGFIVGMAQNLSDRALAFEIAAVRGGFREL
jgi:hypothetical protein